MKTRLLVTGVLCSLLCCSCDESKPVQANPTQVAQPQAPADPSVVPPDKVKVEMVKMSGGFKTVTLSNVKGTYTLVCVIEQKSCLTPIPDRDYLLFDKNTHWKKPGARDYLTLDWLQDWSGKYKNSENAAIIPADVDDGPDGIGMYQYIEWRKK